jgi:hypothetical protein
VYIDIDKSGRPAKVEVTTERLLAALQKTRPLVHFYIRRRQGTISMGWVPLFRVTIPDRDSYRVECDDDLVAKKHVNKDAVAAAMAADDRDLPAVVWG